jgi:hypothetical protein
VTPEQAKKLREPFRPEQIGKIPKGGIELDYVGHAATTDRLLQVDPDWTWEPMAYGPSGTPLIEWMRDGTYGGLWIWLTVCGVRRPGFGDGKTAKEIIGDAIRNAAMRFGVALDLWAKEDLSGGNQPLPAPPAEQENWRRDRVPPPPSPAPPPPKPSEPEPEPPLMTEGQRKHMMRLFGEQGFNERQHRLAYSSTIVRRRVETAKSLTRDEADQIIKTLETRRDAQPDDEVDIPF